MGGRGTFFRCGGGGEVSLSIVEEMSEDAMGYEVGSRVLVMVESKREDEVDIRFKSRSLDRERGARERVLTRNNRHC